MPRLTNFLFIHPVLPWHTVFPGIDCFIGQAFSMPPCYSFAPFTLHPTRGSSVVGDGNLIRDGLHAVCDGNFGDNSHPKRWPF